MKRLAVLILLLAANASYSVEWSRNNIVKFTADTLRPGRELTESHGLVLSNSRITALPGYSNANASWGGLESSDPEAASILSATVTSNPWLRTEPISVGDEFILGSVFVNMTSSDPGSYVVLRIRDLFSDDIIFERRFDTTASFPLVNVFNKNVVLTLEFYGDSAEVYSFGVKRIFERLMEDNDIDLNPGLLYYGEGPLDIRFLLRVPSVMDIVLFDNNGALVDYILRKEYLPEGEYSYEWEPLDTTSRHELLSGLYYVYFSAKSIDGKSVELSKCFQFVNR